MHPRSCSHSILGINKISDIRSELYCKICGQVAGAWVESNPIVQTQISGKVAKLSKQQKEQLR